MNCSVRLAAVLLLAVSLPAVARAQTYQAADFGYETYRGVRTNGPDSTYNQGLTHRYVNGELRFLTVTLQRTLQEFRLPAAGQVQTATTAEWDLSGISGAFLSGFHGIWFEQAKNRLWITSAQDYTATNHAARVTLVELRSGGAFHVLKQFFLDKPAKRVYGGCNAVPAALIAQLGGPYVCGWGGYTSLVMQGGNASIGPTMYAIPDPDTIANGATVRARTILDAADAQSNRGVRATIPTNYFDGGDTRQNPSTPPTGPPVSTASWLSPNANGLGWMVWGDSYYNTGFWIGTTYGAIASLCEGSCWYQTSNLAFDGRQFELHTWDGSRLGSDRLERPSQMVELNVPIDPSRTPAGGRQGNRTVNNLAGATYDPVSGRLYVIGFAMGDAYTARVYSYRVGAATGAAPGGGGSAGASGGGSTGLTSSCTSIRPGPDWNCYNGGWLPPGMPIPGQSSPAPAQQPLLPSPPSLAGSVGSLLPCLSIKPGDGWNCYNGGWLPPGMPIPSGAVQPTQPPAVSTPTPSTPGTCTSIRPGSLWVCRDGNWLPPFYPGS